MRSHGHLPLNDMEGMGSVPLPLSQHLPQQTTSRALKKKGHKWLKDGFPYPLLPEPLFPNDNITRRAKIGLGPNLVKL